MFRPLRAPSIGLMLLIAVLVAAVLCRSGLIAEQAQHALGNLLPVQTVLLDESFDAEKGVADLDLSQAFHEIVHLVESLSSHLPSLLPLSLMLPKSPERIGSEPRHVSDPPASSLFRPPRPPSLS